MKHFVLIACASQKAPDAGPAAALYQSGLFKKSLAYARSLNPDGIFILSAKHGLLPLNKVIEPYELTLNNMPSHVRKEWAWRVHEDLAKVADLRNDRFTFLAGQRYREHLTPGLSHVEVPLEGLGIGKQLGFLTRALNGG